MRSHFQVGESIDHDVFQNGLRREHERPIIRVEPDSPHAPQPVSCRRGGWCAASGRTVAGRQTRSSSHRGAHYGQSLISAATMVSESSSCSKLSHAGAGRRALAEFTGEFLLEFRPLTGEQGWVLWDATATENCRFRSPRRTLPLRNAMCSESLDRMTTRVGQAYYPQSTCTMDGDGQRARACRHFSIDVLQEVGPSASQRQHPLTVRFR